MYESTKTKIAQVTKAVANGKTLKAALKEAHLSFASWYKYNKKSSVVWFKTEDMILQIAKSDLPSQKKMRVIRELLA